jgi:hypothetical protein
MALPFSGIGRGKFMPRSSKPPSKSKPASKKRTAARRRKKNARTTRRGTAAPRIASARAEAARELSGPVWVQRFPGSRSPEDLAEGFKSAVKRFLNALDEAGADVTISATFRPPERAYLMHYAWEIAHRNIAAGDVPPMTGVDIEWVHPTAAAAQAMVDAYDMVQVAALRSRHTERKAIDMSIAWSGTLGIRNAAGQMVTIATSPRTGGNSRLHAVGRTYGVIKLVSDPPHWSTDGH